MADRRMFSRDIFKSSVMVTLGCRNGVNGLEAQRVFEALIVTADDHGRGRLIPEIIRGDAFISVPETFAKITSEMIMTWVEQIQEEGALVIYEVGNQQYYYLTGWDKYQRGGWQKAKSLLPDPPGFVSDDPQTDGGQTADGKQTADEVESKVKEEKEKEGKKTGKPEPSTKALEFVKELFPDMKSAQREAGALILDEIEKQDGIMIDTLMPALRWARANVETDNPKWPGWSKNFRSCATLRKRKHGKADQMKWEKIYQQYKDQELKPPPSKKPLSELTSDDPEYWQDATADFTGGQDGQ